jgi:hypothetical protein
MVRFMGFSRSGPSCDLHITKIGQRALRRCHAGDRPTADIGDARHSLGELMAQQAASYRDDEDKAGLAAAHDGLPDDLANFHHDPLAAAVAAGWDGVTVERQRLRTDPADPSGRLEDVTAGGRDVDLVTGVDGPAFGEHWLATVEALGR